MTKICLQCKREFETTISKQKYCTKSCMRKAYESKPETKEKNKLKYIANKTRYQENAKRFRKNNKESIQKSDKIFKKKLRVATLIKNIILMESTNRSKDLWDGIGRWSKKHDFCQTCTLTLYKHHAGGSCKRCYKKLLYANDMNKKAKYHERKEYYKAYQEANKDQIQKYKQQRTKILEKLKSGEIKITPKIQNILDNYNILDIKQEE